MTNDEMANLVNDAWNRVKSLVETGQVALRDGRVMRIEGRGYASLCLDVAKMKPPKVSKVPKPEGFTPARTRETERGEA